MEFRDCRAHSGKPALARKAARRMKSDEIKGEGEK
jgi:hypothetical protein